MDNQICQALTIACEKAKEEIDGFQWLTHFVDFNNFPASLSIVCVFDTKAELKQARQDLKDQLLINLIKTELEKIAISFKVISRHIAFDTEEQCAAENNGRWQQRFAQRRL